jgi:serine/threonine-protein kinase
VKVLDFGLAKVAGQSRLTKAGVVFGTPHYMSPEQASGGTVDQRTDVYALGVVMYEMFTGRVPFEADTYMGVLTKHLYVAPTPPSVVVGGIHELGALEQVTLRCIEKKADKRYPSMRALANDLARVTHFADDGSLVVKPAELGLPYESSLADELELPGTLELRATHGRRHDEERRHVTWLIAALAFLGLFAVALIAALSFRTNSPGAAALVTAPAPETASVRAKDASNPERAGSAGAVRSEPIPGRGATKPVPAAVDTAEGVGVGIPAPAAPSSARSTAVRGVPIDVPAKTRAKTPRVTAPPAANSPRTKEKSVTGDIVDPWGG